MSSATDLGPFQIFASAIAGRLVQVAPAATGERTWTDGRTIYLETGADHRDQRRMLGVQASLLAAGSLAPHVVVELRGRRGLSERYLAIEGHRALAANDDVLPRWMASMIDHDVADRVDSPAAALALARQERKLEAHRVFGAINARRIVATSEVGPTFGIPVTDGRDGDAKSRGDTVVELEVLDEGDVDDRSNLGNLMSSPVGGGGAAGRLLAKMLRPTRARGSGGGNPGADSPTHMTRGRPGSGRNVISLATRDAVDTTTDSGERATHTYPEWDERRQAYRPDWCRVRDDVAVADAGASDALLDSVSLRRSLARLGTELAPCRRQRQGGDLDIDAVVAARVDRAAGGPVIDDVYIDTLRRTRGLSVLVLLDVSGSAAEPGIAGRSVHDHQRDAAASLVIALHQLGDRVALHAFRSRGRTSVQVERVKGFDEGVDAVVARRLNGLQPGGFTRLGAAIRHGSELLEAGAGTPRRLLVVLSDGFAYDHGYEGAYGEADARRALLEARRRGMGCLCLSVGADADPSALLRVFGAASHAAVPTVDALPWTIAPLFANALRSAEAKRRSYRRTERTQARLASDGASR